MEQMELCASLGEEPVENVSPVPEGDQGDTSVQLKQTYLVDCCQLSEFRRCPSQQQRMHFTHLLITKLTTVAIFLGFFKFGNSQQLLYVFVACCYDGADFTNLQFPRVHSDCILILSLFLLFISLERPAITAGFVFFFPRERKFISVCNSQ